MEYTNLTKEVIENALKTYKSLSQTARQLNVDVRTLERWMKIHHISKPHRCYVTGKLTIDQVISALTQTRSVREAAKLLEVTTGALFDYIRRNKLTEYTKTPDGRRKPWIKTEEILAGTKNVHNSLVKTRLLREGLLKRECYECGLTTWRGKPAPLQMDHIDGDKTNNTLENLRILCCNCHAQTDTYSGRNLFHRRLTPAYKKRREAEKKKEHSS